MKLNSAIYSAFGLIALFLTCATLFFFHDKTLSELQRTFVLGRDGVEMRLPAEDLVLAFDPWQPLEEDHSLFSMLRELCTGQNLAANCYLQGEVRFRKFTKTHRVDTADGGVTLERNTLPVSLKEITSQYLSARLALVAQWAEANQRADGSLPYFYAPSIDTYDSSDNSIRQLITIQGLFAIANQSGDRKLYETAERAQQKVFKDVYRSTGNAAYITDYDGRTPTGATALGILLLREKSKNGAPTATEKSLAEYLLRMQRPDGSFQTFRNSATSTLDDQFYSGEALTALASLDGAEPNPRYSEAIRKGFEYYQAKLHEDFMPQYAPWHMQAFAIAYEKTKDEDYAQYVYWLADGLIETMLKHDPRALPDEAGRFYNPEYPQWGPPHSASTSIYVEGLTYAYQLAKERGDSARMKKYEDAILAGTRSLLLIQWTPESAYYLKDPAKVVGSFKTTITDNRGRVDQTGHTANALVRVENILSE